MNNLKNKFSLNRNFVKMLFLGTMVFSILISPIENINVSLAVKVHAAEKSKTNSGATKGLGPIGRSTINIKKSNKLQLLPVPVQNLRIARSTNNIIILTWNDPNSKGSVKSYEIYRMTKYSAGYKKVASVSNTTSFADSLEDATANDIASSTLISYYVIALSKSGKQSPASKPVNYYDFFFYKNYLWA